MASSFVSSSSHENTSTNHNPKSFLAKLEARIAMTNSLLCVGLDPHENELYQGQDRDVVRTTQEKCDAIYTFCKNLIDATLEYTCCYKPNIAFFECVGSEGMAVLHRICTELIVPHDIPILLDVKRGDIGSTATAYAQMCFDTLPADAITVSPLMGYDSIVPFLTQPYNEKGIFLLCKTSNPGSNDFLNLTIASSSSTTSHEETLYERIAALTSNTWHPQHPSTTFGLVVGATDTMALQKVRSIIRDDVWILAPGIGAQGGNLIETCTYGMNASGSGMIVPISRGISTAANPKLAAQAFHQQIQTIRNQRIAEYNQRKSNDTIATVSTSLDASAAAAAAVPSPPDNKSISTTAPPPPTQPSSTLLQLQDYQKEFIQFSIQQKVLQFGTYTLKSGRVSPYFFNAGLFHTGYALYQLGLAYATTIMKSSALTVPSSSSSSSQRADVDVNFDVIFGPAYKGIPLGAIVSSALYAQYGVNVDFTYNRKEVKDHGEGGQLVGASMTNKRVLIIDDVITAGTAIRESYDILTAVNAIPMGVVIALDRAEIRSLEDPKSAVQAVERDLSIPVVSIITLVELQRFLEQQPSDIYDVSTLQSVIDYRKEYGAL